MKFEIQSKYEVGNSMYLPLAKEKVVIKDIQLVYEFGRYGVKYLVEHEDGVRSWVYEYNMEGLE